MFHFDVHRALDDDEDLVGVLVVVPDELTFEFGQFELVIVHFCNHAWAPVFIEQGQFLCQIDGGHERLRPPALLWFISGLGCGIPTRDVVAFKRSNRINFTRNIDFK